MKKLLTLLLFLISTLSFCQTIKFSGIIHSKFQYFDSLNQDITNSERGKRDLESHYYVNSIGYKTVNEKDKLIQTYSTKNNIYYFEQGNEWTQIAASFEFPKLIKIEQLPGEEVILGYKCRKLKIISSMGEVIHWYSLDLKINKENYSGHLFGNYYDYLKATDGGLTLKYEMTINGSKTISSAYKIDKIEFKDSEFDFKK